MLKQILFTLLTASGVFAAPAQNSEGSAIVVMPNGDILDLGANALSSFQQKAINDTQQIGRNDTQQNSIDTVFALETTTYILPLWNARARVECRWSEITRSDEEKPATGNGTRQNCTSITTCTHTDGSNTTEVMSFILESGVEPAKFVNQDTCSVTTTCIAEPDPSSPAACPEPPAERTAPECQGTSGMFYCPPEWQILYGKPPPEFKLPPGTPDLCCCNRFGGRDNSNGINAIWQCMLAVPGDVCMGGETFPNWPPVE